MVKIKFYGILKPYMPEVAEDGFWHAEKAGMTIGQIMEETEAAGKAATVILVNRVRKDMDYVLQDGDTLTVMPLVAGG